MPPFKYPLPTEPTQPQGPWSETQPSTGLPTKPAVGGVAPGPDPAQGGTSVLPADAIGDIPPPPIPQPPTIAGPGVGGIRGSEAGTFARPGTRGALPFRTPAFGGQRSARFGPGVPLAGGSAGVSGLGDDGGGLGMSPEEVAELLRALAAGRGQGGM